MALVSHAIKSLWKLVLAVVNGVQRKTASPVLIDVLSVLTTQTADMIRLRPSPVFHETNSHSLKLFESLNELHCCYEVAPYLLIK